MTASEHQNINQTLNSQNTLHISTWWASYGLSFVSILETNIAIQRHRNVYEYATQRVNKTRSIIQRIIQRRSFIFISMSMKFSVTILSWSESKDTGISTLRWNTTNNKTNLYRLFQRHEGLALYLMPLIQRGNLLFGLTPRGLVHSYNSAGTLLYTNHLTLWSRVLLQKEFRNIPTSWFFLSLVKCPPLFLNHWDNFSDKSLSKTILNSRNKPWWNLHVLFLIGHYVRASVWWNMLSFINSWFPLHHRRYILSSKFLW